MDLLTLVLVDDEPIILKGLTETYPWEEMGFFVTGTARGGREAMALIEEKKPDLVLTDIRMKNMDGLTLIAQVREKKLPTNFVIISAYRDFDYAKKACEMGVLSYLVKPFEEAELITQMRLIYESCMEQKKKEKNYGIWKNILIEDRENFLNQMLFQYLEDNLSENELINFFQSLSQGQHLTDHYVVIAANIDIAERIVNQKEYEWKQKVLETSLYKLLKEHYTVWNKKSSNGIPCYIVSLTEKAQRSEVQGILETLTKQIGVGVISGISSVQTGIGGIKRGYLQALKLFEAACEAGDKVFIESQQNKGTEKTQYSIELESQIIHIIKGNQEEQLKETYKKFIFALPKEEEQARIFIYRLAVRIEYALMDSYGMVEEYQQQFQNFYQVAHTMTGVKLVNVLYQLINNIVQQRKEINMYPTEESYKEYISQAVQYIEAHMQEETLSITDVSEQIFLNPVYFGRVFKNIMGMSFKRYVQNVRLEHAKELILEEDMSIAVLCSKVGIPNPSYFSQLFKQHTGVLPSEYRRKKGNEV